jgi:tRNA dimethylallyltransferase
LINSIYPLVIVAGPTAAGKSALALHLAAYFDGEIVNGDSLQLYRGMDIGTAKPTLQERQFIPHHLFDVLTPDQVFSAGDYSRLCRPVLREIASRSKLPVLVGGSGFYIKALLEGLAPSPSRNPDLRQRLLALAERYSARRDSPLYRILRCWDPSAAQAIHPRDSQKIIRAIEIIIQEKKNIKEVHSRLSQPLAGFRVLLVGLDPPRDALRARIQLRTETMFRSGFVEEVARLRAEGYGPEVKAMESVGYKQVNLLLDGKIPSVVALEETVIRTRQYAKRQMTWFRKMKQVIWYQGFGDSESIQSQVQSDLEQILNNPIKIFCEGRNQIEPAS